MATEPSFDLLVRDRENIIFQGPVTSVSSSNDVGKFDVLGEHANFISLLSKSLKVKLADGTTREFAIGNGIIHVNSNKAQVYLGVGGAKTVISG